MPRVFGKEFISLMAIVQALELIALPLAAFAKAAERAAFWAQIAAYVKKPKLKTPMNRKKIHGDISATSTIAWPRTLRFAASLFQLCPWLRITSPPSIPALLQAALPQS
jgi:hypothetical protein